MHDDRTFSGKVRKLKQHRRASASRLRPAGTPPSPPGAAPPSSLGASPSSPVASLSYATAHPSVAEHHQQGQHAAAQAGSAQHAQQHSNFQERGVQQLPLLVEQPGFGTQERHEQHMQAHLLSHSSQQSEHKKLDHLLGNPTQQIEQQKLQKQLPAQRLSHRTPQDATNARPRLLGQILGHLPAQLLSQLPGQQQQQQSMTRVGRRPRATADAAGLACIGLGKQEEQSRMTQSGPLHPPSATVPAAVPELFEVRH